MSVSLFMVDTESMSRITLRLPIPTSEKGRQFSLHYRSPEHRLEVIKKLEERREIQGAKEWGEEAWALIKENPNVLRVAPRSLSPTSSSRCYEEPKKNSSVTLYFRDHYTGEGRVIERRINRKNWLRVFREMKARRIKVYEPIKAYLLQRFFTEEDFHNLEPNCFEEEKILKLLDQVEAFNAEKARNRYIMVKTNGTISIHVPRPNAPRYQTHIGIKRCGKEMGIELARTLRDKVGIANWGEDAWKEIMNGTPIHSLRTIPIVKIEMGKDRDGNSRVVMSAYCKNKGTGGNMHHRLVRKGNIIKAYTELKLRALENINGVKQILIRLGKATEEDFFLFPQPEELERINHLLNVLEKNNAK